MMAHAIQNFGPSVGSVPGDVAVTSGSNFIITSDMIAPGMIISAPIVAMGPMRARTMLNVASMISEKLRGRRCIMDMRQGAGGATSQAPRVTGTSGPASGTAVAR